MKPNTNIIEQLITLEYYELSRKEKYNLPKRAIKESRNKIRNLKRRLNEITN